MPRDGSGPEQLGGGRRRSCWSTLNVALASCAARSLRGEDTRVREGLAAAMRRIGPILGWTAVAGTVGVLLSTARARLLAAHLADGLAAGRRSLGVGSVNTVSK
jgi:Family of unknown function (DUF6159)